MRNIIVREYLESLTEKKELDYIFPILLEVMNFKIISTPKKTAGLAQYGKDVIAVGTDKDGIKKRFYFEVKGGEDRDITTRTYQKDDGVRESIREAKDRVYTDSSNPGFNELPVKIVVVHNGTIHPSVKETFDGMIANEFPQGGRFQFERWDLYELTQLFTDHLFNEYLLVDDEAVVRFKRVLVLINTPGNDYKDFFVLLNFILEKAGSNSGLKERKRLLLFETIRLVSFIVYHYAKEGRNLEVAKKCIPYAILRLWHWILENKLQQNRKVAKHFRKIYTILLATLNDYFNETIPIATIKDGLLSEKGGRYEQIGYPVRAMEYLSYLILNFQLKEEQAPKDKRLPVDQVFVLIEILNKNDGMTRPFFDNHSIPICLTLNFFIAHKRLDAAKSYLKNVLQSIRLAFDIHKRLPDGHNRIESVIQLVLRKQKSVYYEDKTSHLLGALAEYLALLDMEEEYYTFKTFVESCQVYLAVFEPFDDEQLKRYLPGEEGSHELGLFKHELFKEGYQSEIRLEEKFEDFKSKTFAKTRTPYEYATKKVGFNNLPYLAHVFFKTPIFPSEWRNYHSLIKRISELTELE